MVKNISDVLKNVLKNVLKDVRKDVLKELSDRQIDILEMIMADTFLSEKAIFEMMSEKVSE